MKIFSAALVSVALLACGDPSGPEADLAGEYLVTGVTLKVGTTSWEPVPTTYDLFRDGQCVRTLEKGTLEIEGAAYRLDLVFDAGCPGYLPEVITEAGEVTQADAGIWYRPDGLKPGGDVCGSWLGFTTDRGDLGLISPVAHPCLGGAVWYFRFQLGP
ncbi:MAG: hypothetical protein AMXMBFR53_15240 [Gemmatimonadota bacterium]